ncbi:MAG: aspartate/glutamate racemase family protein [Rhodospirillales bacterium]
MPRISLIHATRLAIDPVVEAFTREWPQADVCNLLEDSLAPDLARDGEITATMTGRFVRLAGYVRENGADAILFTCSAFGASIEAAAGALAPVPVLKPNEAMFEDAIRQSKKIGMVATFAPSIPSMEREFAEMAAGTAAKLSSVYADGAMAALAAGDGETHDRLICDMARRLDDVDLILMAQFSTARARGRVEDQTGKPVLTSPDSAVQKLRRLLGPA